MYLHTFPIFAMFDNNQLQTETSKVDVDPRSIESEMPQKWGFSPICDPQSFFF